MSGESPSEYELADLPDEPEPTSTPKPESTPMPPPPPAPGQPLPRIWKSGGDDGESTSAPGGAEGAAGASPRRRRSRASSRTKPEPTEKKGLIEATPTLDTHEARQRGRLLVGFLILTIIGIGVHLVYRTLIYDPFPMDNAPLDDDAAGPIEPSLPPKPNLNDEARAMLSRAREAAEAGRTETAVALLERLVATYGNTPAAAQAREALERASQNLPPFFELPAAAVAAPTPTPTPKPKPPAVADARTEAAPKPKASTVEAPTTDNAAQARTESPEKKILPVGFSAQPGSGLDPSGWPLVIIGERDGAPMVFIPGGVFTMGDDHDQQFAAPAHKVRLSSYYIDQHEVTVGQFHRFLAETNYRGSPPTTWPPIADSERDIVESKPMVMVNADDARAYAAWAGKQLPTEAQWEGAARSGDGRVYPWGNEAPNYSKPRAPRQIDAVMSFPEDRSAHGVFDLAGNALEWTTDIFDPSYYRSIADQVTDNPTGARPRAGRSDLVVKGGKTGAAAAREPISPEKRLNYVGFRCALQVERPPVSRTPEPVATPAPPREPIQPRRPAPQPRPQSDVPF